MTKLAEVVALVPVGQDRFVSHWPELSTNGFRLFGGGLLALMTQAATLTVAPDREAHSLKAFFLSSAQPEVPIDVHVDRIYDGSSFCARTVTLRQDGVIRATATVSFHPPESGEDVGLPMPNAPRPDEPFTQNPVLTGADLADPFDIREVAVDRALNGQWVEPNETGRLLWVRLREPLAHDPGARFYVPSYLSDFGATIGARTIFGAVRDTPGRFGSLNHSLWWHRRFALDDWLLIDFRPLTGASSLGLVRGTIHTVGGVHVATFLQEALMRIS